MKLSSDVKHYIKQSVLCWLATSSSENTPNVSPKEIFTYYGDEHIIIANIASPQSVANIKYNQQVCVSFVDILIQKGFKVHGTATIIDKVSPDFKAIENSLTQMTLGQFPFSNVIKIHVKSVKPIIAPRYLLYPGTSEADQIASAKKAYDL